MNGKNFKLKHANTKSYARIHFFSVEIFSAASHNVPADNHKKFSRTVNSRNAKARDGNAPIINHRMCMKEKQLEAMLDNKKKFRESFRSHDSGSRRCLEARSRP